MADRDPPAPPPGPAGDASAGCRAGDRGSLEEVFRAHAASLERLLVRLVGPRADVEDLLQDTFSAAIQAFPRFRGEASVKTWLHRIAVNVAHKYLRSPSHRAQPLDEEAESAPDETPEARVAREEIARRLYVHLDKLDAKKRVALVLYVLEDLSIAEVAALTGASQTATKS